MNKKEDINTVTNEVKTVLLRAEKELNRHKDELKKNKKCSYFNQKRISNFVKRECAVEKEAKPI